MRISDWSSDVCSSDLFDHVGALPGDYYPQELRAEIDAINARVYETLNNGVYRSGFATTQEAYEEAVHPLFETLDWLEEHLTGREWLVGDRLTEADIRSEEHTSELQSLMRSSYAVFCLKKKNNINEIT